MLSTIAWTNRGTGPGATDTDGFNALFGANANLARQIVDRAIDDWEGVIVDFHYNGGGNTFNLTVQTFSFTGGTIADGTVTGSSGGKPTSGRIRVNNNAATHWLDPTPNDDAEFTNNITNPFTGFASGISGTDFFATTLHELGHVIGITNNASLSLASFLTNTGIDDPNDNDPGNLLAFNVGGGPIEATFTAADAGHLWEGPATPASTGAGLPTHPDYLMNSGRAIASNERNLISNTEAFILQMAYNYTIASPQDNMMVTRNDTTGVVTVRPQPGTSGDSLKVTTSSIPGLIDFNLNEYHELVLFAGTNTINIDLGTGNDGVSLGALSPTIAVNVTDSGDPTGPADKLEIIGGAGYDLVTVNSPSITSTNLNVASFSNMEQLWISLEGGGADVYMPGTAAITSASIYTHGIGQTINLHSLDIGTPTLVNLSAFGGTLNIAPNAGFNAIQSALTINCSSLGDIIHVARAAATGALQWPITINGSDGDDLVTLAPDLPSGVSVIEGAVTFNGGNGDDALFIGSGSLNAISGPVNFNGGPVLGNDRLFLNDITTSSSCDYTITDTVVTRGGAFFGGVNFSVVLEITLHATQGPNTINFTAANFLRATINGNGGDDTFIFGNGNNLGGGVGNLFTNGGEGFDTITFNDALSTHNGQWAVSGARTAEPQTVFLGIQPFSTAGFERVSILAGNGNNPVRFLGTMTHDVFVDGGGGNDSFEFLGISNYRDFVGQNGEPAFNYELNIIGGSGFNTLTVDDRNAGNRVYAIDPQQLLGQDGAPLGMRVDYDSFQRITLYASIGPFASEFYILGTSSDLAGTDQMTIFAGSQDDSFAIFPRDAAGNLTINGNLGISGGGGIDTLVVEDSGSSIPISYLFRNLYGSGTTNIDGMGARGFGAASDVEAITINAGGGGDSFNINSFQSGSGLRINAGSGNDTVNFGNSVVTSEITNMSSFHYDGQAGSDTFNFNHGGSNAGLTYYRNVGTTSVYGSAGQYYGFTDSNIEAFVINASSAVDGLYLDGAGPGLLTIFNAGGGIDGLALGYNVNSLQNIRGPVVYYGGANGGGLSLWDGADSTGDSFHLTRTSIGASPGDNLFGPGGSLTFPFSDLVDWDVANPGVYLGLGSGADTAFVEPLTTARLLIDGNNPTAAPGDTFRLSMAGITSPVFTPNGPGAGTYSFGNAAGVSYSGFEAASAYMPGDYSGNGIVGPEDYVVWRGKIGSAVPPGTFGDGSGNGVVDAADYVLWRKNLGASLPASGSGSSLADAEAAPTVLASNDGLVTSIFGGAAMDPVVLIAPYDLSLPGIVSSHVQMRAPERRLAAALHDDGLLAWLASQRGPDLAIDAGQDSIATTHRPRERLLDFEFWSVDTALESLLIDAA